MKVAINWLREFIDIPWSPRELAYKLEMTGTAVESITDYAPGFAGVVTGVIKSIDAHPQADKLQVTRVDAGTAEEIQIVCGAANIVVGQKVPVALVGAELPGGRRIGQASLRGIESHGMLCSETELELGDDARGIMILDPATPAGQPLAEILDLNDTVIEFEITPNRPDCMSMIGIAREIGAMTGGKIRLPASKIKEIGEPADVIIRLEAPDLCPRYSARVVRDLTVAPSPFWLRRRLVLAGVRPINNLVDITNYILLETGQPLHGFDQKLIDQNTIIVRRAAERESMTTLDGEERELNADMLVIADAARPVALAGVMGGANSEINEATTDCLLESAYFEPTGIFRTSFELDLRSEASARFERGTDPNGTLYAADRAAYLMQELAGGKVAPKVLDEYSRVIEPLKIVFRTKNTRVIIGADISDKVMLQILRSLDMGVEAGKKEGKIVTVPTWRPDLTREIDLVEEVARIYGFENVPSTIPDALGSALPLTAEQQVIRASRDVLAASGLRECVNYAFIDPADLPRLLLPEGDARDKALALKNPLSANQSVMRPTLLPGLLRTARFNAGYGIRDVQLFEIGRVFADAGVGQLPIERNIVAGLLMGAWENDAWYAKRRPLDFYDLKGIIEALVDGLALGEPQILREQDPLFHPGQRACLIAGGQTVGSFGLLHPSVAKNFELEGNIFAFELDAAVLAASAQAGKRVVAPSRFPAMNRDISFLVSDAVRAADVNAVVWGAGGELLAEARVFDLYEGSHVPEGMKSLGYSLTYQSSERTLTVEETDAAHARVLQALQKDIKAQIR